MTGLVTRDCVPKERVDCWPVEEELVLPERRRDDGGIVCGRGEGI